jgi:F-type H+-transporting ATPase subunit delta
MDVGLIARRYATVLYDFASKRQELAEVNSDAQNIRGAFAENRVAYDYLSSPVKKMSEKKEFLFSVFNGSITSTMMDFLMFVADKERVSALDDILRVFQSLYKKSLGIKQVDIVTACKLLPEKEASFAAIIEKKLGTKIDASFRVDESLLGGMVITIDGKQLDCSVQRQLREIENSLTV